MLGFHPLGGGALGEGARQLDAAAEIIGGYGGKKQRSLVDLYGQYRFLTSEQIDRFFTDERGPESHPPIPVTADFDADVGQLAGPQAIVTPRLQARIARLKAERETHSAALEQEKPDDTNIRLLLLLAA